MKNLQENLAGPLRSIGTCLATLLLLVLAVTTRSQAHDLAREPFHDHGETHRSLGAHVHGVAQLLVASDTEHLHITLQTPAVNVVGFEHNAATEAEREQLAAAQRRLNDANLVAIPSPSASCEPETAAMMSTQLDALDGDGHDAHHQDNDHHSENNHRARAGSHSDFEVAYRFHCSNPGELNGLTVTLFRHFPGFETVNVQWVVDGRQGARRVNPGQTDVRF